MNIYGRFHEGREFPIKQIGVKLNEGFTIEVCDWSPDTEMVNIYEKFILKNFKYSEDGKFLDITFNRVKLAKEEKEKCVIINTFLEERFKKLKYSLTRSIIEGMERALEIGDFNPKDYKDIEEHIKKRLEEKKNENERCKDRAEEVPKK